MFASSPALSFGSNRLSASTYRDVDASTSLDGAGAHKLVSLLYAALVGQIARARGAIARKDTVEKGRAISHAMRIIDEGLRAPLDMAAGGAIASNLRNLYDYLLQQLTLANLRSDDAALGDCARLVDTLREGWEGIATAADSAASNTKAVA